MKAVISVQFVVEVHDAILKETGVGRAGVDRAKLEGGLGRVDHQMHYNDVQDIFEGASFASVCRRFTRLAAGVLCPVALCCGIPGPFQRNSSGIPAESRGKSGPGGWSPPFEQGKGVKKVVGKMVGNLQKSGRKSAKKGGRKSGRSDQLSPTT